MPKLLQNIFDAQIEKINFDKDHLYAIMAIPPKYSIVDTLKWILYLLEAGSFSNRLEAD